MNIPAAIAVALNFLLLMCYEDAQYNGNPPYFKCSFPTIYDYAPKDAIWVAHMAACDEPPAYIAFVQTAPDGQPPVWDVIAIGRFDDVDEYSKLYGDFSRISKEQKEELMYELAGAPELVDYICEQLNIDDIKDMPRSQFLMVITALKKARSMKEEELFT